MNPAARTVAIIRPGESFSYGSGRDLLRGVSFDAGIAFDLIVQGDVYKRQDHILVNGVSFQNPRTGAGTVSYTHLDVYKRQLSASGEIKPHAGDSTLGQHGRQTGIASANLVPAGAGAMHHHHPRKAAFSFRQAERRRDFPQKSRNA